MSLQQLKSISIIEADFSQGNFTLITLKCPMTTRVWCKMNLQDLLDELIKNQEELELLNEAEPRMNDL